MTGEWRETSLDELIDVKHGFAFKGEFFRGEPPGDILLTPGNFAIGGGFKADKFKYYDGPVPDEFVLSEGDLIVTMTDLSKDADTLGYPAFIPSNSGGCRFLHNQRLGKVVLKGKDAIDLRYLHYLMCSQEYRHEVVASATGTTVKHTSPDRIKRFRFRLPPSDEQRAIAHILGALGDKIELPRRMNETLEAMAQALFKSWFVDFDPIHAKEGHDPSLPKAIADLFPDRFQGSELGEIPAGWRVGRLDEILVLQRGFDLPTPERTPGPYPVIAASGPNGTHNQFMVRGPGVTTGRSGVLGNVFYIHEDFWPLNTSLWVRQFKHSTPTFAFHLLRDLDFSLFNAGSAVPTLNRNHVHNLPVVIPSMSTIQAFEDLIIPILKRQKSNVDESRTLAAIRDTLLPKLISGELRVKDAEQVLKACGL
jgi:type I restriction enzyme S subunit